MADKAKVDSYLDERQSKKEFKDLGERVSGSRKERFAIAKLSLSDLAGIERDQKLAGDLIIKEKVISKEAMVSTVSGFRNPGLAYLASVAYSAISKKSADNPVSRYEYVRALPEVLAWFEKFETVQQAMDARWKPFFHAYFKFNLGCKSTYYWHTAKIDETNGGFINIDEVFGKRFMNMMLGKNAWYEDWHKAYGYERNNDWSWLKKDDEEQVKTKRKERSGPQIHDFEKNERYVRRGDEVLFATGDTSVLLNSAGLKSVQFGQSLPDAEAGGMIRMATESFYDISKLLGAWFPKIVKQYGLSMAFGARGRGHACAHYESFYKIINLTRGNGDGSLAHELGHFIDNVLYEKMAGVNAYTEGSKRYFVSEMNCLDAADLLVNTMKEGSSIINRSYECDESKYTYPSIDQEMAKGGVQGAADYIVSRCGRDASKIDKYMRYVAYKNGGRALAKIKYPFTTYYATAMSMGDYWCKVREMFARAFEAYVLDRLEQIGVKNNYLVSDRAAEELNSPAYPHGEERVRINQAFDHLFRNVSGWF